MLLGKGDGGFWAPQNFPVGVLPYSLVVADFDGDQKLDLAVSLNGEKKVAVLLGDGKGSFGPLPLLVSGDDPRSIAVGDFNGDKKPDIVNVNYQGSGISVFLNTAK